MGAGEREVAFDDRVVEALAQAEQALFRDRAGVRRAQGEAAARGVGLQGVQEGAADDLDPGDHGLRRAHILLQEADSVDRRPVLGGVEMLRELVDRVEQPDAVAFPALVRLDQERGAEPFGRGKERAAARDGQGARHVEAGRAQRRELISLAHLQFERPAAVHHAPPARFEPAEHGPRVVLGPGVVAGVRRGAHSGPEDPGRRLGVEVQHAVAEQPGLVRDTGRVKGRREGRIPLRILVQHMNLHRAAHLRLSSRRPVGPMFRRPVDPA